MSPLLALAALIAATPMPQAAAASTLASPSAPPQFLPLEAEWCPVANPAAAAPPGPICIRLEVPRTPRQFAWGLMQRPPLPPLRGMWFRFDPPQAVSFWMHRTPAPLDMVFVRGERVVAIEAAAPCPRLPCRSYGPEAAVDGVVELGMGQAAALGIAPGGPAPIRWLAPLKPPAPAAR
jgi:uncharacterized membrane protein (UPF0127 family)